jgi:pimeloyl-ACP methyl ester carboxylesterase
MPIVENNQNKICYEAYGNRNNPCMVLVMGVTGQLITWPKYFIDDLVNAGFYVLAFDNRDVGFSQYYDEKTAPSIAEAIQALQQGKSIALPYTLDDMVEDIVFLLNALAIEKMHLLGISMGGQIAQRFSIKHQARLHSLILLATSTRDQDLPPPTTAALNFFFKPKKTNLDNLIADHVEQYKIYTHPNDFDLPSCEAAMKTAYDRAYHPEGNQRQLLAMMFATGTGEKLKNVLVPSLIIHGDYDPVFPITHGEHLARCLANASLVQIDRMGHSLPVRVSSLVISAIANFIGSDFIISLGK